MGRIGGTVLDASTGNMLDLLLENYAIQVFD